LQDHLKLKKRQTVYSVRIPWTDSFGEIQRWDIISAWVLEKFGLPGDKFTTHPTENHMDFVFRNKHDAEIFTLRWV